MAYKCLKDFNVTAEVFFWLQSIGFFLLTSIVPQFLLQQSCYRNFNSSVCNDISLFPTEQETIQQDAAFWLSMTYVGRFLPSCFTLMVWGSLVDYIGPHKGMLVPPSIMAVQAILFLVVSYFPASTSAYVVVIASLPSFYGDFSGLLVVSSSYVTGITSTTDRSRRLTFLQGGALFMDVLAGFAGGYALEEFGFQAPFAIVAFTGALNFIFVYFFAKPIVYSDNKIESKSPPWKKILNPFHHFKIGYRITLRSKYRKNFLMLLAGFFFAASALRGDLFISVLFITNAPFNFTPVFVGYYLAYIACIQGAGSMISVHILTRWCKVGDFGLFVIGLVTSVILLLSIGLSKSTLVLFLVNLASITVYLAMPVFRSNATKLVHSRDSGKALSLMETVGIACSLAISVIATTFYRMTLEIDSGFVYFVLTGFAVIALVIVCVMQVMLKKGALIDPSGDINISVMLPMTEPSEIEPSEV